MKTNQTEFVNMNHNRQVKMKNQKKIIEIIEKKHEKENIVTTKTKKGIRKSIKM